jgi:hypothetical protein
MRNRSKDGGRYAQDHYRNGDRCDCDGHYGMGSIATGHDQSAGRRQRRADARASPVVKSRASNTLTDNGCGPGHMASQGRRGPVVVANSGPYIFRSNIQRELRLNRACMRGPASENNATRKGSDVFTWPRDLGPQLKSVAEQI